MLLVLFHIAGERYGLDALDILEVRPDQALRPLPGSPAGVAGLLSLADGVVPVIDVGESVTGRVASRRRSTRILIVRPDFCPPGSRLGLRVEALTDAVQVDPAIFNELAVAVPDTPCLGPVARLEDGLVQRVRLEDLFSPEIRASIERAAARPPEMP